ncbi:MAG: hypothetical protein ACH350_09510 [Parachlamydiaceae bacterium]
MEIHRFFQVVKQDWQLAAKFFADELIVVTPADKEKLVRAQLRIAIAAGMVFAAISCFAALSTGAGVIPVATRAVEFALFHDGFVYMVNLDRGVLATITLVGNTMLSNLQEMWSGSKTKKSVPHHPDTTGTYFRPIWDALLAMKIGEK